MNAGTDGHAVPGIEVHFGPAGGRVDQMVIKQEDGAAVLRPLHRAPWVASGETLPDSVALVERRLAGGFFCAPFGNQPGHPIHGWSANGTWVSRGASTDADSALTATYCLQEDILGAQVTKHLTLRPGHPFVYLRHRFSGGRGHLPVGHHAMIRVPGGARLSFSESSWRGRRRHRLVGGFGGQGRVPVFSVKDARRLPETILCMSNGGRSYAPWLGRHSEVLGVDEVATSCHANGRFENTTEVSAENLATGLVLDGEAEADIRYGFGAIPAPPGWTEVASIQPLELSVLVKELFRPISGHPGSGRLRGAGACA